MSQTVSNGDAVKLRGLVLFLMSAALQGQAPTAPPAAISGVVTDAVTNQPVPGAFVELRRAQAGTSGPQRVTTDSKGRFVFIGVEPAAGYSLGAGGAGYGQSTFGWKPGMSELPRDVFTFPLADNEWRQDIVIQIWRLGTIAGRVFDEHGDPVVGASIRGYSMELIAGIPRLLASSLVATTDDRGAYRLAGLVPGQYRIGVLSVQQTVPAGVREVPQERSVGALAASSISIGPGSQFSGPALDAAGSHRLVVTNFMTPPAPAGGRPRAYPPIFYPGVRAVEDAPNVKVGHGTEETAIDFRLQPVAAFTISGRLQGALGGPLLLRLLPAGLEHLANGSEIATTLSEKDGAFTFLNVPAGSYTLLAQGAILDLTKGLTGGFRLPDPPGYPSAQAGGGSFIGAPDIGILNRQGVPATAFARQSVIVSQEVRTLVVPLTPTVTISGRVVFAPGTERPPPPAVLFVRADPVDADPSLGVPDSRVDAAGAFSVSGLLSGRYRLWIASSLQMESVMWRGKDLVDAGFDTRQDTAIDDVVVTMTNRGIIVKGAVRGIPANGRAAVIVFPASKEEWVNYGFSPRRMRSTTGQITGTYELPRIPAGEYFVVAVDASRITAWTDPKFLAAAAAKAQRITVGWGDAPMVDLTFSDVVAK